MCTCSISIPDMDRMVGATESAVENIPSDVSRLSAGLNGVMLSSTEPHRADSVAAWLENELPGLRRRLALARVIEASEPGIQTQVVIDESAISTASPHEAAERADGVFREGLKVGDEAVLQARRQLDAADGMPVQWQVAEPEVAQAFRNLFEEARVDIEVIHVPFDG